MSPFHQRCNNKNDTLVLIRTEFGKTIGGYTHYPWKSLSNCTYVSDSGCKAFIFSLDMKEKFVPKNSNHLIRQSSPYGPIFGNGPDIYIADSCNVNNHSGARFPITYNRA